MNQGADNCVGEVSNNMIFNNSCKAEGTAKCMQLYDSLNTFKAEQDTFYNGVKIYTLFCI